MQAIDSNAAPAQPVKRTQSQAKLRLSDTAIKNAKPRDKPYRLFDGNRLYVEVSPAGGKAFYVTYAIEKDGKKSASRKSLGKYPLMTLSEARQAAFLFHRRLLASQHPDEKALREAVAAEQRAKAAVGTFGQCAARYMERKMPEWSESHAERCTHLLQAYLLPAWEGRQIADIKPADMIKFMDGVVAAGKVETGRKAFQLFGSILAVAIMEGFAVNDWTVAYVKAGMMPKQAVKHFAAVTDPAELGQLLRAIDGYSGETVKNALLATAHLFQRHGDIRAMKWSEIDLDAALWTFSVSKTKQVHTVPLSTQMIDLLKRQQALNHYDSPYVFHCLRSRTRPLSENGCRAALRSMGFDNDTVTPHGFRATARTMLDEVLHERVELIEHQLAHSVKDPLGRAYNRTSYLPERVAMMQRYSDYLDSLKAGENV